jgi:predicted nucleotidyltransferase
MNIDSSQEVCGYPAPYIRGLLRAAAQSEPWDMKTWLAICESLPQAKAKVLLGGLQSAGLIAPYETARRGKWYEPTMAGRAFTMASLGPRIKRATAERNVKTFLERVAAVNADEGLLYCVDEVVVFGSYLSDVETLGDIDLAFSYSQREAAVDWSVRANLRVQLALSHGRRFSNIVEQVYWPETEFRRRLRDGCRSLSLHDLKAERSFIEAQPHKQLYQRTR